MGDPTQEQLAELAALQRLRPDGQEPWRWYEAHAYVRDDGTRIEGLWTLRSGSHFIQWDGIDLTPAVTDPLEAYEQCLNYTRSRLPRMYVGQPPLDVDAP